MRKNNNSLENIEDAEILFQELIYINKLLIKKDSYINNKIFITLLIGISTSFVYFSDIIYKSLDEAVSKTIKLNDAILILNFKLNLFLAGSFVLFIFLISLLFYNFYIVKLLKIEKIKIVKKYSKIKKRKRYSPRN